MDIMKTITYLFVLPLLSLTLLKVKADEYLKPLTFTPSYRHLYLNLETQGYLSHSNYVSDASSKPLGVQGNKVKYIAFTNYKLGLSYLPDHWIEIQPYVTAQTHYSYNYLQPFQFNDVGINIQNTLRTSIISIYPSIDFSYPILQPIKLNERVITSDPVLKFTPSVRLYFSYFKLFTPFARIAFQYRNEGLSGLFIWQAGFSFQIPEWQIGFLFGGFASVVSDIDTKQPQKKHNILNNRLNIGSLKFYSVNPAVTGLSVWTHLLLGKKVGMQIKYNLDFTGQNYAKGQSIHIHLIISVLNRKNKKSYKNLHRFREVNTRSNHSIF